MNYCLFKFRFYTPLHIGDSSMATSLETADFIIRADTFFSALCHTALSLFGEEGINKLYKAASSGEFKISDSLPYKNGVVYVPKPFLSLEIQGDMSNDDRKAMKKITHIPLNLLRRYLEGVLTPSEVDCDFCIDYVVDKVNLRKSEKSEPYSVSLVTFHENCGLSVIVGYKDKEFLDMLKRLIAHLGLGGIGGKVSSGYGKFDVTEVTELDFVDPSEIQYSLLKEMLNKRDSNMYILLATSLPKDEELETSMEGASYSLMRRGGFIQSVSYSNEPLKKKTQLFFLSGSVFCNLFEGDVYDVGCGGKHAVYRYSKPVFLGVK